jgi:eukaryotic-like serine/threonine-protein kinase
MPEMIAARYEVIDRLGAGVLGEVVKVRDTQQGGTLRAIKLFKPQVVSASNMGRFEREFRSIARLSHPNIVEVYDFGVHGERPYFSMELLDGSDLRRFITEVRPKDGEEGFEDYARRSAYVFHQIADALAVVHTAGIVHRDLKPENIFVKWGRFPRAKLLDFGHAKAQGDNQNLTVTGTVLGTAWYIPPEQAMGKEIGPAADLYSLGCVIFETLTGKPPFSGKSVVEVILSHLQREAPDPRQLDPRIPEKFAELCGELLRKDPAQRPASAALVAEVLADDA